MTSTTMTATRRRAPIRLAALGFTVVAALGLTACGSSSSAEPAATESAAPGGPGGGFGGADFQKITACLKAAGIDVPDLPSGMPSNRPSGMPSGMPSDRPSGRPSGAPSGFPGGGRGGIDFSDAKVNAALKACGITVPTGMPTDQASS